MEANRERLALLNQDRGAAAPAAPAHTEGTVAAPVPKKRGRKPKIAVEAPEAPEPEVTEQAVDPESSDEEAAVEAHAPTPKKRGRKPKNAAA